MNLDVSKWQGIKNNFTYKIEIRDIEVPLY